MANTCEFAYIQARLQARYGLRPPEQTWARLESTVDSRAYLHASRSALNPTWVDRLTSTQQVGELERHLRATWFREVDRVARWSPAPWRDSVRWWATLALLPGLQHLRVTGSAPTWMLEDDTLAFPGDMTSSDAPALFRRLPVAELMASPQRTSLLKLWHDTWASLWPRCSALHARQLNILSSLAAQYADRAEDTDSAIGGPASLAPLERALVLLFRRAAGSPAAIFSALGLTALDLQRLRGGLLTRHLFPQQPRLHAWQ